MEMKLFNSASFDEKFQKLLKNKKGKNAVKGRLDLEPIKFNAKAEFIIVFMNSLKLSAGITYKISFWENDSKVEDYFKLNHPKKKYVKTSSYKNRQKGGVVFLDEEVLDIHFLKSILSNHFNFEMAKTPSLNIRVQLSAELENYIILLDIYDDRGLDIYFISQ